MLIDIMMLILREKTEIREIGVVRNWGRVSQPNISELTHATT